MKTIEIKHVRTGSIIFSGFFRNIREAAEQAITENVSLSFADLRHANLAHAELDGGDFDQASLEGSNLTAANLSECSFHTTRMAHAQLHSAVLCQSQLEAVDFRGALFGATDITDACISHCQFDTLSALDMGFTATHTMALNSFSAFDNTLCGLSRPPLVIKGLALPLACLDSHILIGLEALPFRTILDILTYAKRPPEYIPSHTYSFLRAHKNLLNSLMKLHRRPALCEQKAA